MQVFPSPEFLDRHLAPGYSAFAGAELEELSNVDSEQDSWLVNFVMSQFTHEFKPVLRELLFNFIRRTHGALDAYHELRLALAAYPPYTRAARRYVSALSHAEVCVSFAAQAFEIANVIVGKVGHAPYLHHASPKQLERLHDFYRGLKHIPGMLAGSQFESGDTVLFWFTPAGLQSRKRGLLSYADLSALLRELARDARIMSTWGPEDEP